MKILFGLLLSIMVGSAANPQIPASDWAQIKAEYERHRHSIHQEGAVHKTHSPYQQWNTTFTGNSFLVKPKEGNWTWGLKLRSYGLADKLNPVPAPTRTSTFKNQIRQHNANLEQWFVNDTNGLEQGWTILSRPEGSANELIVELEPQGNLLYSVENNAVTFRDGAKSSILNYTGLKAWDRSGKALRASLISKGGNLRIAVDQKDASYPITIDPIAQQAYLKASNTGANNYFGYSVAISGDTIVVGAILEDSNTTGVNTTPNELAVNSGAAYVFTIPPPTINISVASSPTGLLFSSVGTGCAPGSGLATPLTLAWTPASACTLTFGTPQSGPSGTQYVFAQWEDASTNAARNITAPVSTATYTATFTTQFLLTATANPPAGGSVTPASATFFNAGSNAAVTATPTGCYSFLNWSGGTVSGGNIMMDAPKSLTGNFALPSAGTTTRGPILTVRGIPNRFRQSIVATNTLGVTADISIALDTFGSGVSIVAPAAPTGTTTSCFAPASRSFYTIANVPAGQSTSITFDFNAPNAAGLTYNATTLIGPGPR